MYFDLGVSNNCVIFNIDLCCSYPVIYYVMTYSLRKIEPMYPWFKISNTCFVTTLDKQTHRIFVVSYNYRMKMSIFTVSPHSKSQLQIIKVINKVKSSKA